MNEADVVFAGYRLEQLLATDTVSSIYRATPTHTATRPVALRITHQLRAGDRPDAAAIAAYIRQLSAALRVNHPALSTGVDAGEVGDRVWVATALVESGTLGQYLRDRGRLPIDDAVLLLRDIADGLDRAHEVGVVHGAISSRTIGLRGGPDGPTAVLRGFGIAGLLARQAAIDRSAIDLHDVDYVAPEQLRGDEPDGRADQYALACALYHCVTGGPPYTRDSVTALFGAHLFSPVPIPSTIERQVAGALAAGMGKTPDRRHESCTDLLRAAAPDAATRSRALAVPDTGHPADRPPQRPVDPRWADRRRHRRRQRRGVRLGGHRWPTVAWPVATMVVLSGILTTLGLATVARGGDLLQRDRTVARDPQIVQGAQIADGPLPASDEGPVAAAVRWQRTLTDEAIYQLEVMADRVLAVAPHGVYALGRGRGATAWASEIDVGVLTDVATTDAVVALRAATLRGLALADGAQRWQDGDIVAPLDSLVAANGTIYGIAPGRVASELVAIDASSGAPQWHYRGGARRIAGDAVVAAGDGMVVVADEGHVTLVDPSSGTATADDGRTVIAAPRWQVTVERPWIGTLAVLPDAVLLATRTGQVCAYDPADGVERWCQPVDGLADERPTLLAARDVVVVVRRSTVTALALETGVEQWTYAAPRPLTPIAACDDGQVIVADTDGRAHGVDLERGYEAWRASGFDDITALAVRGDAVFVATSGGRLVHVRAATRDVPS